MSLSDPTSGAGYAFGEKLPSTDMTTIATQQDRALDIIDGGSFANDANVTITAATGTIRLWNWTGMSQTIGSNRTISLADSTAQILYTGDRVIRRAQPFSIMKVSDYAAAGLATIHGGADWAFAASANAHFIAQSYVDNAGGSVQNPYFISRATNLINGAALQNIGVYFHDPTAGTVAQTYPSFEFRALNNDTGAVTVLLSQTFAGTYRNGYSTQVGASSAHTVDVDLYSYYFSMVGESGTNAVAGGRILGLYVNHTVSNLDES